jgi:hypothetical protein
MQLKQKKIVVGGIATIIIGYNIACDFYVGNRFLNDPRADVLAWAKKNIPKNSSIERDSYTPLLLEASAKEFLEKYYQTTLSLLVLKMTESQRTDKSPFILGRN